VGRDANVHPAPAGHGMPCPYESTAALHGGDASHTLPAHQTPFTCRDAACRVRIKTQNPTKQDWHHPNGINTPPKNVTPSKPAIPQ